MAAPHSLQHSTAFAWVAAVLVFCLELQLAHAALECYACDSAEDAECATKPGQQINVEECLPANDVCVTAIEAGHTRRGCLSRLYPAGYCAQCERCTTNLCNRDVYPADRLRCYQCSGADCGNVTARGAWLLPCPVYHVPDRCYTNVIGLSNVLRGCERTNIPADCPHVCLKCNYDGCNDEMALSSTTCLQCSHTSMSPQPECVRQQERAADGTCASAVAKRCANKLMHGHAERCYTYINEQTGVVERGCSGSMPFYPSGNVSHCRGEDCNTACFSIACNQCDTSVAGEACRLGRTLRPAKCAPGTLDCYSCETATGRMRRGCADAEFTPNADAAPETCQLCRSGDGCNRYSVRTCYHCSSLEDGAACAAQLDDAAASLVQQRNCTHAAELCVSTLVNHYGGTAAYTVRGCAAQVPECTAHDALCVRCNGSLCNTQPIASWFNGVAQDYKDVMLWQNEQP